jgi:hypothetical protein
MMRIPAVFIAAALIGLGSVIEETGRPGAVAASHLFYGWGIVWAICFGWWMGKE